METTSDLDFGIVFVVPDNYFTQYSAWTSCTITDTPSKSCYKAPS